MIIFFIICIALIYDFPVLAALEILRTLFSVFSVTFYIKVRYSAHSWLSDCLALQRKVAKRLMIPQIKGLGLSLVLLIFLFQIFPFIWPSLQGAERLNTGNLKTAQIEQKFGTQTLEVILDKPPPPFNQSQVVGKV